MGVLATGARGSTTAADTLEVEYIRGSDYGGGIGGVLYTLRSGAPAFNHYNSRGDVVAKTNDLGELTWQAQYEAFGTQANEFGNTQDRQKANTKDEDPTGLLNEGFRYRDLETGTFITRDPLGFVDGPNVYTYVIQNPWTYFDPTGLKSSFAPGEKVRWYHYVGAAFSGAGEGARGGTSIVTNSLSLGMSDRVGITKSDQYQGPEYTASRISAAIGTTALYTAAGMSGTKVAQGANALNTTSDVVDNVETAVVVVVAVSEGEYTKAAATVGQRVGEELVGKGVGKGLGVVSDSASRNVKNNVSNNSTGSYTNTHASGKKYHGKGTEKRMNKSAKEKAEAYDDPVVEQDFKPAENRREAFKDEARRIREDGGVDNPDNYNKINSPGEKYLTEDGE